MKKSINEKSHVDFDISEKTLRDTDVDTILVGDMGSRNKLILILR
jgi:hypothetical protein